MLLTVKLTTICAQKWTVEALDQVVTLSYLAAANQTLYSMSLHLQRLNEGYWIFYFAKRNQVADFTCAIASIERYILTDIFCSLFLIMLI